MLLAAPVEDAARSLGLRAVYDSGVWFVRAGGRDLGSWNPLSGSVRIGPVMLAGGSTDAAEVMGVFALWAAELGGNSRWPYTR